MYRQRHYSQVMEYRLYLNFLECTSLAQYCKCGNFYIPTTIQRQIERYNWILPAMLRCDDINQQQKWNAHASILTHAYNSQIHRSTTIATFDLVLNQCLPDFTLKSIVFFEKILTTVEQRTWFLAKLRHSLDCVCASIQRTQKSNNKTSTSIFARFVKQWELATMCLSMCRTVSSRHWS